MQLERVILKNSTKFSVTRFMKELKIEEDKIIARHREEESNQKPKKKKHYMGWKYMREIGQWKKTK